MDFKRTVIEWVIFMKTELLPPFVPSHKDPGLSDEVTKTALSEKNTNSSLFPLRWFFSV